MIRHVRQFILPVLVAIGACLLVFTAWRLANGWRPRLFPVPRGVILGEENGVAVHAYGWGSQRGEYGLEYECVELINRYYVQVLGHRNMTRSGHADSYFWDARAKGLRAYPNGGSTPPAVHDILVFDGGPEDGSIGHVAIIVDVNVSEGTLTFIEQNSRIRSMDHLFVRDVWKDRLPLTTEDGTWTVEEDHDSFPIAGWSRVADQTVSPRSLK